MKRREFLKQSGLATGACMVPSFVKAFDATIRSLPTHKKLVVIQLSGGNDGLNTLVPYQNDIYYAARPQLNIEAQKVLRLSDELGLHPKLEGLRRLYDQGHVSIINNVGYPNPNRSHFRSTDIWHTASHAHQYLNTGWIGRYLDLRQGLPHDAIEVDERLSLALKGATVKGIATKDAKRLFQMIRAPYFQQVLDHQSALHLSEHNLGYLYQTMIEAESSARYIYEKHKVTNSSTTYPNTGFAKQLKTIAEFISSGLQTKVYYASLNGFDTHANQPNRQARLLGQYSEAIEAFVADLKATNAFKDTLILTFSEFGRRVQQNSANGTDHGAANVAWLIGKTFKTPGIYNPMASLKDLDAEGDLKFDTDFRAVYTTLLDRWLEIDPKRVLQESYTPLNFI